MTTNGVILVGCPFACALVRPSVTKECTPHSICLIQKPHVHNLLGACNEMNPNRIQFERKCLIVPKTTGGAVHNFSSLRFIMVACSHLGAQPNWRILSWSMLNMLNTTLIIEHVYMR